MNVEFQLGAWMPDQADFKNPGLEVCKNVMPGAGGYKPIPAPVATGVSVSGVILGTHSFERADNTPVIVVATTTDIYTVVNGALAASGLGLALPDTELMSFEQFNSQIFASCLNGATWRLADIEVDTTFAVATPPRAQAMGRVGDFLVLGNLFDLDSTFSPYRLRWSPFNDPNGVYGTDIATQKGAVDLDPEHGPITAISGGTFGIVFQRSGISRMTYTGSASVFNLEIYEKNLGCIAPNSVVRVGDRAYYLAHESFSMTDGSSVSPISTGRIWDWFLENVNEANLRYVEGFVDYRNRCVGWSFPTGTSRNLTDQLFFNWETNQWSHVCISVNSIVQSTRSGLSLEQVAAQYPNLDTMPVSLDSPEFQAQGKTIVVFQDNEMKNLSGDNLEATFQGGDIQPVSGRRTFVDHITPLIEGVNASATISVSHRNLIAGPATSTGDMPMGSLGFSDIRRDARYFNVTMKIPSASNWEEAIGYQIEHRISGSY